VHTAHQLALVLAVGKSKVPFYVAGGLLVAWALFVSMAIGMRRPDFPSGLPQERLLIAISAMLVLATVSSAVIVSGGEGKPASAAAATPQTAAAETQTGSKTSSAATTESAPASTSSTPTPTATTGTPPPPSSPAAGKTTKVALAADPGGQLAYDTRTLRAKAGTVSIVMANMSPVEHNVTLAEGSKPLGATPTFVGGSKTLTLKLKPGTYTFYCSVPGHRQAGMEGTLTVSP
jgi:plastocyanin